MVGIHNPFILDLLETRMGNHNKLAEDLGFPKKIKYPSVRSSGGLVIMWEDDNLSINDINISPKAFTFLFRLATLTLIGF